ncbi:MAG: SH3 domain-containing protein [Pseudomonadota bacterium]
MTCLRPALNLLFAVLGGALVSGCSDEPSGTAPAGPAQALDTDVPGIEERHLTAGFWLVRTRDADRVLMSEAEIAAFNSRSFDVVDNMLRLESYPQRLNRDELTKLVRQISKPSDYDRWYADGRKLDAVDWARYDATLNLDAIEASNDVRFGLVVERASMRSYPTDDPIFNTETPTDIDRFQENGLFPADAVAVLHTSRDGEWLLVQSFNYLAWVRRENIALGSLASVLDYQSQLADEPLVVTGDKVFTNYNPHVPAVSELQLDMGVRLPRIPRSESGNDVHGQNPYTSHVVRLPVREADGSLSFEAALIARGQDVRLGYLPYTRANVIRQSFKFLGERYGWGHSYNARDCTGFVSEVYKTFGILLPRNSGDQRDSVIGGNRRFDETVAHGERVAALDTLDVGNLIYIPGHVMLHLGEVDGEPYVIHDVNGLNYALADGSLYSGVLSTVAVTPLMPLRSSKGQHYVDLMMSIKQIR